MTQKYKMRNASFLHFSAIIIGMFALCSCTTSEDEAFTSAFDTPITSETQNAMDQANDLMLNKDAGHFLTRSAVQQDMLNTYSSEDTVITEEQPQLDWSQVKRWEETTDTQTTFVPVRTNVNPENIITPFIGNTLNTGDTIEIRVYGDNDLSGSYTIDPRGIITIPLIGDIQAAGLSKIQLQNVISQTLQTNGFLENPYVTVTLSKLQPFYILGEIRTPGQYEYTPNLDVFKAIATAGGYTPRASKNKIYITRIINGQKVKMHADEHTDLMPGDSIVIEQRFF